MTEAGYVGEDVENLLLRLVHAADFEIEETERGIIYIDEIDKIARSANNRSITRDVSGEGVQQALLKMIEGSICNVPPQGGRKHPEQQFIQVDTKDILFVCGGSFTGLEKIVARRLGNGSFGFGSNGKDNSNDLLSKVEPEDFISFGLIPELVGRLPVIAHVEPLGIHDLCKVLVTSRNSLVKQYQKLFDLDGVHLFFREKTIFEIARKALEKGTGARGLRTIVEAVLEDHLFELPDMKIGETVVVEEDEVRKCFG